MSKIKDLLGKHESSRNEASIGVTANSILSSLNTTGDLISNTNNILQGIYTFVMLCVTAKQAIQSMLGRTKDKAERQRLSLEMKDLDTRISSKKNDAKELELELQDLKKKEAELKRQLELAKQS